MLTDEERLELHAYLSGVLGHERLDLIDLRRTGGLLLHLILHTGDRLLVRDSALLHHLVIMAMDFITDAQPAIRSGQQAYLASLEAER